MLTLTVDGDYTRAYHLISSMEEETWFPVKSPILVFTMVEILNGNAVTITDFVMMKMIQGTMHISVIEGMKEELLRHIEVSIL